MFGESEMNNEKAESRTPLKDKPLRQAGESLREKRERILEDKFSPWALGALMAIGLAGYEWFRFKMQPPYSP